MDQIYYVEGVPKWFTYCLHWRNKRRWCRQFGHTNFGGLVSVCDFCGEILGE